MLIMTMTPTSPGTIVQAVRRRVTPVSSFERGQGGAHGSGVCCVNDDPRRRQTVRSAVLDVLSADVVFLEVGRVDIRRGWKFQTDQRFPLENHLLGRAWRQP
jgi:hypothetical protein